MNLLIMYLISFVLNVFAMIRIMKMCKNEGDTIKYKHLILALLGCLVPLVPFITYIIGLIVIELPLYIGKVNFLNKECKWL
jgi:hypothetical protein